MIAAVFIGPLLVASLIYSGNVGWQPIGRTNNGRLLTPIVNLDEAGDADLLSGLTDGETDKQWLLIYVDSAECRESCREALYRMRQSRLMLGKIMNRLKRVFLHGASAPDTVFLDQQHRGLITINHNGIGDFLLKRRPQDLPVGGLYLVDPLGNLVMYFDAELDPRDMVSDIKHLLKLSRIG